MRRLQSSRTSRVFEGTGRQAIFIHGDVGGSSGEESESATAQLDIVVNAGKAYVEVPTTFEGELNCDVSGGRVLREGETLPKSYRQRAVNNR
jgi:hypothetical protein